MTYHKMVILFSKSGNLDINMVESLYWEILNNSIFLSYLYFMNKDWEYFENANRNIAFGNILKHSGCCLQITKKVEMQEDEYKSIYEAHGRFIYGHYKHNINDLYEYCRIFYKWMSASMLNYFFEWLIKYETEDKTRILEGILKYSTLPIPDTIDGKILANLTIRKLQS